jgi:hypothetical protein
VDTEADPARFDPQQGLVSIGLAIRCSSAPVD